MTDHVRHFSAISNNVIAAMVVVSTMYNVHWLAEVIVPSIMIELAPHNKIVLTIYVYFAHTSVFGRRHKG